MKAPPEITPVLAPLQRLTQRVRWKRWLAKSHRFVLLFAALFLGVFLADMAIGMRTLTLRMVLAGVALTASMLLLWDGLTCWLARLDLLGLAQILEKRYPALSERLLTLVQMDSDPNMSANAEFAALLRSETAQQLATVEPESACPIRHERRAWLITAPVLSVALIGMCFVPAFREFSGRFLASWSTPLTPYRIELSRLQGYALRGSKYTIEGTIKRQDPYAPEATECQLVRETDSDVIVATTPIDGERFAIELDHLRQPLRCRVVVGETRSEWIEIDLIDPPALTATPLVKATPPAYVTKLGATTHELTASGESLAILQYSRLSFAFAFDQACRGTLVLETTTDEKVTTKVYVPLQGGAELFADIVAAQVGLVRAELHLKLAHDLSVAIPLGSYRVHADRLPRFTVAPRFLGGSGRLQSTLQYRISPDDVVRLETAIADAEGLSALDVEFRLNDELPYVVKWIDAAGKQQLKISERMPLPKGLKQGDRVQFRLRARDNRALGRGEIDAALPPLDLGPQTVYAPDAVAGGDAWIQLYVDQAIESFVKQQAEAQREEVRSVIDAIKKKILDEAQQVEKMKRSIHLQAALTLDQRTQTEKMQLRNREIVEDLLQAGQRFLPNPELARLAEHFLDIAENEMQHAGDALARFGEKDRPLVQGEKELQTAHDALLLALKKLERMTDWNKMLAQDRLDQAQLDKLAQRQQDLADRLEKLRNQEPKSDAQLAKQIEEIRQEQARLAEQTEKLKDENRLVQESLASLERERVAKLAQDAEKLAADQQAQREMPPEQMPAELKERLMELAQRQADLAKQIQAKPAHEAADALNKPNLDRAIDRQKEQEKHLQAALGKLVPDAMANGLREQIMRLAQQQQEIRADLERVGQQVGQLDSTMVKQRLAELVARQRNLQSAIAKLPIDANNTAVRAGRRLAEQTVQQAADLLAAKNALDSFYAMEKAQQQLETLARMLPATLVKDRKDIKDPATQAKVKQVDDFAAQQKKLREDTEKLQADWMKAVAGKVNGPVRKQMDQLAKELLELAQKGSSPKAKALAKEAASTLNQAKKAMDAGKDAEAAKQMDLAVKQLQKFAQEPAKNDMSKTAQALKDGAAQMKSAQASLPKMTKDAQAAMQDAADKLAQAASQASKQTARNLPKATRKPMAQAGPTPTVADVPLPRDLKLEPLQGKSWGELPGELKTRMIQDFRTRYGEEYAEVIQQYFERLAQTPASPKSGSKN